MPIEGKCPKCGYEPTIDYSCIPCMYGEIEELKNRPNLLQLGDFTLNSGAKSAYKLECDALTDADWDTIAWLAAQRVGYFTAVEGVPRGGLKLAEKLKKYVAGKNESWGDRLLIVDDVGTTGNSMNKQRDIRNAVGLVVFARNPLPPWIKVLFRGPMLDDA